VHGGVYRAFSPGLNGDSLSGLRDQQLDAERSTNLALGVRGQQGAWRYEATLFRMDFANQIFPANSNTDFQATNGGKTLHQGLEFGLGYALGGGFGVDANATWVRDARFVGDRFSATGVLSTPGGNRVPYTPQWLANPSLAYGVGPFKAALAAHHTGRQFSDAANTVALRENTSGFLTGQIAACTLADLTASVDVDPQLRLFGAVKNLTDRRYIASLRQGIDAGPSRSVEVGARYRFQAVGPVRRPATQVAARWRSSASISQANRRSCSVAARLCRWASTGPALQSHRHRSAIAPGSRLPISWPRASASAAPRVAACNRAQALGLAAGAPGAPGAACSPMRSAWIW
jgi:hypothetical protein